MATPTILTSLVASASLCLTSNSWVVLWSLLEINTIAFSSTHPSKMKPTASHSKDAMFKYFTIQSTASAILIMACLTMEKTPTPHTTEKIISIIILVKMGASPMHTWLSSLAPTLSWTPFLLITTIQKLPPLALLLAMYDNTLNLMILASIVTSSLIQLKTKTTKEMLTLSSIFNNSWLIASSSTSLKVMSILLTTYWAAMCLMINLMSKLPTTHSMEHPTQGWWKILTVTNLAGLPPSMNFIGKIVTVKAMLKIKMTLTANTIMIANMTNIYLYLKSVSPSMTHAKSSAKSSPHRKSTLLTSILMFTPLIALPMSGHKFTSMGLHHHSRKQAQKAYA